MTSATPIPTGNETLPERTHWVYAEMLPIDGGNGFHDLSGEFGTYPRNDGAREVGVELTNLQLLQIAAVNAQNANGSINIMYDHKYLSAKAIEHNQAYTEASSKKRSQLGDLIGAVVVWGIDDAQLTEALLTYDPMNNSTDL